MMFGIAGRAVFVALLVAVIGSFAFLPSVFAVDVTDCGVLNQSDTSYYLQNNISNATGICINITGYNVTFIGNDFKIVHGMAGSGTGIHLTPSANYTKISNVTIGNPNTQGTAIFILADHVEISNVTIGFTEGATEYVSNVGMMVNGSYLSVKDVNIRGFNGNLCSDGVYLPPHVYGIANTVFENMIIDYCGRGFYPLEYRPAYVNLTNITVTNANYGIYWGRYSGSWTIWNSSFQGSVMGLYLGEFYGTSRIYNSVINIVRIVDADMVYLINCTVGEYIVDGIFESGEYRVGWWFDERVNWKVNGSPMQGANVTATSDMDVWGYGSTGEFSVLTGADGKIGRQIIIEQLTKGGQQHFYEYTVTTTGGGYTETRTTDLFGDFQANNVNWLSSLGYTEFQAILVGAGSGLGGFLTAIKDPVVNIVLVLGIIGGILSIFYGIGSAIRKGVGGASASVTACYPSVNLPESIAL